MLEIVGVTGVVHLGQIQSGLRGAMRIAQVTLEYGEVLFILDGVFDVRSCNSEFKFQSSTTQEKLLSNFKYFFLQ